MTARAKDQSGNRFYIWTPPGSGRGERYWGVTTIIDNAIPKRALMYWAAKMAALEAVKGLDSYRAMLDQARRVERSPVPVDRIGEHVVEVGGVQAVPAERLLQLVELATWTEVDEEELDRQRGKAVDLIKDAHRRTSTEAKVKGSQIHDAVEAYQLRRPYPGVPRAVAHKYRHFLRFLEEHRPVIEASEVNLYSRSGRYAGTCDGWGLFPSLADEAYFPNWRELFPFAAWEERVPRIIFDWKTSGSGVYSEVALQLSAYARAEFAGGPDGSEQPVPHYVGACENPAECGREHFDGAMVVWLSDDDYHAYPVNIEPEVYDAFQYARQVFRWVDQTQKGVVGKALPYPPDRVPEDEIPDLSVEASRPCPSCGTECDSVESTNARAPRWRCTNAECKGGKDGKPWAGWERNPWKPGGAANPLPAEPAPDPPAEAPAEQAALALDPVEAAPDDERDNSEEATDGADSHPAAEV